jgi:hypothetical protein
MQEKEKERIPQTKADKATAKVDKVTDSVKATKVSSGVIVFDVDKHGINWVKLPRK